MKKVTFAALVRSGPRPLVTGFALRCGAVVHRSLGASCSRFGQRDDNWAVSDPVSGAAYVCNSFSLGDAVTKYRAIQRQLGADHAAKTAMAQQAVIRQHALEYWK